MAGVSDGEVIGAILGGDTHRYAELVGKYQSRAWKLAYGLVGNWEEAKDLSQNAFVKAYRNLARFRRSAQFSTWLYRIVVNECKDFFRSKARRPSLVPLSPDPEAEDPIQFDLADPAGDPSDAAADQELAKRLGAAIGRLAMKQRTAFVLHHLNGMSLEEVSRAMGCRVGTVKAHLFRATEALRRSLAPYLLMEVTR
ncbi:MAG: sigma-70 family RNA polymerase sigma factor [Candidatus Omnitrophica bacterium]|nr:sigma-70 family RNA polymerase sigma factor [Candidatus Omnitrophota bacterium]